MNFLSWFYSIRAYVQSYGGFIKARWLLTLVWALAIAAVVWFYGDSLSFGSWRPLATTQSRLIAVGVVFAVWLGFLLWRIVKGRRADQALIGAVSDGAADPKRAADADVAELRDRLKNALKLMRKALGGRNSVYKLPWYLLIGPPGAGKTTALCNSGLKFPLAEAIGDDPVQGVAGTRHCDWWFTDEAILIDTAGRYTMQDSEAAVDKAAWKGFLKLLKRHRPRQPVNGAIVMLGLDDVLGATPAERLKQARAIRGRLRELDDSFGVRVPVYLLFTKADRLSGFQPFFAGMPHSGRQQVWGLTLPLPDGGQESGDLAKRIARGFDRLVERLNGLLLDRLQREVDRDRRTEILAFPSQVALLSEPLHEMIGEITASSRFDPPPRVRGLYLASGQQEGQPADLVTRAASARFGIDLPRLSGPETKDVKSFFLARLFSEVIFGEASLVSMDPRREARRRRVRRIAMAAAALLVTSVCAFWGLAYLNQSELLARTDTGLRGYTGIARTAPSQDVDDADFVKTARLLDVARNDVVAYAAGAQPYLGVLDQSEKVRSGGNSLYIRALDNVLAPRLLVRQMQAMRAKPADPQNGDRDRLYLMIAGRAPVDAAFARRAIAADFSRLMPGDEQKGLREHLDRHVAALFAKPIPPIGVDEATVAQANARLHSADLQKRWAPYAQACDAAISGRYPFDRGSVADMPLDVFGRTFGPNGIFDSFFRSDLQKLVDVSRRPWRWSDGAINDHTGWLQAFERAAAIRTAFFAGGGPDPAVDFEVTPLSIDARATSVLLAADGQEINYTGGPAARATSMTWPRRAPPYQARVSLQPDAAGATILQSGPWALFRVMATATIQPLDPGRVRATFDLGGRHAAFSLVVANTFNPFALDALHEFRCPGSL